MFPDVLSLSGLGGGLWKEETERSFKPFLDDSSMFLKYDVLYDYSQSDLQSYLERMRSSMLLIQKPRNPRDDPNFLLLIRVTTMSWQVE